MRSETVVFPASMCAMIPMLRMRVTSRLRPGGFFDMDPRFHHAATGPPPFRCAVHRATPARHEPHRGRGTPAGVSAQLPGEVAERLVRLGHLVDVLALGEGAALSLVRGDDLLGERRGERTAAPALPCDLEHPTEGEG